MAFAVAVACIWSVLNCTGVELCRMRGIVIPLMSRHAAITASTMLRAVCFLTGMAGTGCG